MITVQHGQTATVGITITLTNGFNQPVTFSCVGLPAYAACSFSPTTVTPATGAIVSDQPTVYHALQLRSETNTAVVSAGTVAAPVFELNVDSRVAGSLEFSWTG